MSSFSAKWQVCPSPDLERDACSSQLAEGWVLKVHLEAFPQVLPQCLLRCSAHPRPVALAHHVPCQSLTGLSPSSGSRLLKGKDLASFTVMSPALNTVANPQSPRANRHSVELKAVSLELMLPLLCVTISLEWKCYVSNDSTNVYLTHLLSYPGY